MCDNQRYVIVYPTYLFTSRRLRGWPKRAATRGLSMPLSGQRSDVGLVVALIPFPTAMILLAANILYSSHGQVSNWLTLMYLFIRANLASAPPERSVIGVWKPLLENTSAILRGCRRQTSTSPCKASFYKWTLSLLRLWCAPSVGISVPHGGT